VSRLWCEGLLQFLECHIGGDIGASVVSQEFPEEQPQILRLTTPMLKSTHGAPFAQDDSYYSG
jgi:hypothetical protein